MKQIAFALMFMLGFAAVAHAQRGDDAAEGNRKKVREKIRAARAARIIALLDLDEKTSQKLFPIIDKYDDQILPIQADSGKARRELKSMIDGGKVDDAKVNTLVDQLVANRGKVEQLELDRIKDVRKVLTPTQVAKLVIALPQIDREIGKDIRKALRKGGGKRGGGDGDDDDQQQ